MEQKRPYCAFCQLLVFPYEMRVVDKEKTYHPNCFDKAVEREKKGGCCGGKKGM